MAPGAGRAVLLPFWDPSSSHPARSVTSPSPGVLPSSTEVKWACHHVWQRESMGVASSPKEMAQKWLTTLLFRAVGLNLVVWSFLAAQSLGNIALYW